MELERQSVAVLQQLGRTYRAFAGTFEKRMGLPLPRWRILQALHHQECAIGQKALADLIVMDPGALTRQLKAMQELGWVERTTSERDNRVIHVRLSAAGKQVVVHAMPPRSAFLEAVLSEVSTTTLRELSRGLAQLEAGIAHAQGCAANQANAPNTVGPAAQRRAVECGGPPSLKMRGFILDAEAQLERNLAEGASGKV